MSSKQQQVQQDGIYRSAAKSVGAFPEDIDLYSFMFEDFRPSRVSAAHRTIGIQTADSS